MRVLRAIYTFLMKERTLSGAGRSSHPARTKRQRKRAQRGVALVTVLIAIAITLVLTNQFGTTTNIDLFAAANYRDQMRSHFLARSSQNLAELVIRLQQRVDNIQQLSGVVQLTDFADQIMLAFCGSPEEVQAAVGFSTSTTKGLGADIGTCGVVGQIGTEDDKINLNCANSPASALIVKAALDGLVYFPAYDPIFEEADAEGWRRDRTQQVNALVDYIDKDTTQGVVGSANRGGGIESDGYESLRDPYKPKNNYIDSLGEAKLVRGVDDRFWTLFGSAFTAYGGCKINLSAVTNSQLIASILYLSAADPNDPILKDPKKLFALAALVAKAKTFGVQFTKTDDFIEFVKDPEAQIGSLAGQSGTLAGSAASAAVSQGSLSALTGGQKLKLELKKSELDKIAMAGPRRTYRVQAWGEIERKQKNADGSPVFPPIRSTIDAVWDTKVVPQNARKPPAPKGAWVYMREN